MRPALPTIRSILVLAWMLHGPQGGAQVFDKVKGLLVEDSLAPAKYDSTYVLRFRRTLVLSGVISNQGSGVDIEDKQGGALSYSTNTAVQYGFGVALNWLSVEATFAAPALDPVDPAKGITDSRTLGITTTGRHFWGKALWNTSKGFYAEDPLKVDSTWVPGDPYPTRTDLESRTFMLSANYGFNKRHRYSQRAATSQMERQRRSAGTGVLGGSFWYSRITADGSVVPAEVATEYAGQAQFDRLQRYILAVKGGYTHSFTFWGTGYINLMLLPGIGVQRLAIRPVGVSEVSTDWVGCSVSEFRAGFGYNGAKWYSGLTFATYVNSGEVTDEVRLGTSYTTVRFAAGIRIKPPRSGFMRSIGL
jgi:hypothetical protein